MIVSVMALAAAATLQPTGKWVVDFADSSCVLSRQYGLVDQGFSFNLKAPIVGKAFEIIIASSEGNAKEWDFGQGWIEKPDGRRISPLRVSSYSTEGKVRLSRISIDPELYVIGEDGERLILHFGKWKTYDLALPGFAKAMDVLEVCQKDLRKTYGVDEQELAKITTPAKAKSKSGYFSSDDYPLDALRRGEQGRVGVLFWIEADGRVKECRIVESSQSKSLDDRTCEVIIERARFNPALNAAGQPVRSPSYTRTTWVKPG